MNQNIQNTEPSRIADVVETSQRHRAALESIKTLSDRLLRLDAHLRDLAGVNPTDFAAVQLLADEGPQSMGAIAAHLGVSSAAATAVVDRLERSGHAVRTPAPDDRRRVVVTQTESSRALMASVLARIVERFDESLGSFDDAVLDGIRQLMTVYIETIDEALAAEGPDRAAH